MDKQQEYVLRTVEERDIRFIRLWFTDVLGFLKSVAITPAELDNAFEEGIGFDGSAIEGFARVQEADMLLAPDATTFQVLPWRPASQGVARMFCDVVTPVGQPSEADPRQVLKRQLQRASELGFTFYVHPELDPAFADMPIVQTRIDDAKLNTVLSNSFGFGGTNATLAFGRYAG